MEIKQQELGPLQQRWIDTLRSGNYRQGQGNLKEESLRPGSEGPRYCCLGLACELFKEELGLEVKIVGVEIANTYYNNASSFPPRDVWEALGLYDKNGPADCSVDDRDCVTMNDTFKFSFKEIADRLETKAHLYFKEPR